MRTFRGVQRVPIGRSVELSSEEPELQGRVLVVDDVQDAAASLAMVCELYGAETRTALDGLEAVRVAAEFRPDVILMDITMPTLNGYDAARRIREQDWCKNMVLIALTGWGQPRDVEQALAAGFDGHLLKPVEPLEMLDLVRKLRKRRG